MTRLAKYEQLFRNLNCWCNQRKKEADEKGASVAFSPQYWLGAEASADIIQSILQDGLREMGKYSILRCERCER